MSKKKKSNSYGGSFFTDLYAKVYELFLRQWGNVLIVVIIVLFGIYMFISVSKAPYFLVNTVEIFEKNTNRSFSLENDIALGSSVFRVDLKDVYRRIKNHFPEYDEIVVKREPPGKILVSVKRQMPFAQFKSGRFFSVSKEGLLLPEVSNLPMPSLPIIVDENKKIKDSQIGTKMMYENMQIAFELIDGIKALSLPEDFQIYEIDITDKNNMYLYQKGGIEIRIGSAPFEKKLWLLESAFKSFDIDSAKIKYIDLRFEDVVIGPK